MALAVFGGESCGFRGKEEIENTAGAWELQTHTLRDLLPLVRP